MPDIKSAGWASSTHRRHSPVASTTGASALGQVQLAAARPALPGTRELRVEGGQRSGRPKGSSLSYAVICGLRDALQLMEDYKFTYSVGLMP